VCRRIGNPKHVGLRQSFEFTQFSSVSVWYKEVCELFQSRG